MQNQINLEATVNLKSDNWPESLGISDSRMDELNQMIHDETNVLEPIGGKPGTTSTAHLLQAAISISKKLIEGPNPQLSELTYVSFKMGWALAKTESLTDPIEALMNQIANLH